jgi:Ca2+-binding EF-hand superfamily protein
MPDQRPAPTPLPECLKNGGLKRISLSPAEVLQIREIFNLFDTDGGGSIDRQELEFAMTALGFHSKDMRGGAKIEAVELMDSIVADGKVTLDEFTALMTGEVSGRDPFEEARTAFAVLSQSDGDHKHDGIITLSKLEDVCQKFEVVHQHIPSIQALSIFHLPFIAFAELHANVFYGTPRLLQILTLSDAPKASLAMITKNDA